MSEKKSIIDFLESEEEFGNEHDEIITDLVSPYLIRITKTGNREYTQNFHNLPSAKKILIDSLVKKAIFHKKGIYETESITPKEIFSNKTLGVSESVAKKVFNRELKKVFRKSEEGYEIPNNRVAWIKGEFFNDGN